MRKRFQLIRNNFDIMSTLQFKPYEWNEEDRLHVISICQLDIDSVPHLIRFENFKPSFIVQLPSYEEKEKVTCNKSNIKTIYNS